MTESGLMGRKLHRAVVLAVCGFLSCASLWAQSDDSPMPLGDLARSLRKKKDQPAPAPSHPVIDNDNLSQVMDEVESHRVPSASLLYSFDNTGRTFQVSAPDATCTLSFNSNATSLLATPYVPVDLPDAELAKLDGPATISADGLQVSIFNGTEWKLEEITVGLTIVRHNAPAVAHYGSGRLVAAASESVISAEKQPDVTTIHHLRAMALPSTTTLFKTSIGLRLGPDEEWHWAIIQARGIPPTRLPSPAISQPIPTEPAR
jgi:hypothetical protein